jgi:hypothetical protein
MLGGHLALSYMFWLEEEPPNLQQGTQVSSKKLVKQHDCCPVDNNTG